MPIVLPLGLSSKQWRHAHTQHPTFHFAALCQTGANSKECCAQGTVCKPGTGLFKYSTCCAPTDSKYVGLSLTYQAKPADNLRSCQNSNLINLPAIHLQLCAGSNAAISQASPTPGAGWTQMATPSRAQSPTRVSTTPPTLTSTAMPPCPSGSGRSGSAAMIRPWAFASAPSWAQTTTAATAMLARPTRSASPAARASSASVPPAVSWQVDVVGWKRDGHSLRNCWGWTPSSSRAGHQRLPTVCAYRKYSVQCVGK